MFRYFVGLNFPAQQLSDLHPVILEALLERCWNQQFHDPAVALGHPDRRSDVPGRPDALLDPVLANAPRRTLGPAGGTVDVPMLDHAIRHSGGIRWPHLIYAYMIENTRVVEVFRRVADAFLHGERLSVLSAASQRWLWTTEELFLRDSPSFSQLTQTSTVRPQLAATRANAYQRMFGMTLNAEAGKIAFSAAEHANADFVPVIDELLYELWQGRSNFRNQVGARPTDDAKMAQLATRLCDMLRTRRGNGTLSREEFAAVSTMEWFHVLLSDGAHPVLADLKADASSPEERLFKIAQRVGYPAHGLAKSYFEIAAPLSRLLTAVEQNTYNDPTAIPALYTPQVNPGGPAEDTDVILTHWSLIRGRDVKAKKIAA